MKSPYLFGSRMLSHISFWLLYYFSFGLIWAKDGQYLDSFYLEFILLPVRVLVVYFTLYTLLPKFLLKKRFLHFFLAYALTLIIAGILQRSFIYFFQEKETVFQIQSFLNPSDLIRSVILINSTTLLLVAVKIYLLYLSLENEVAELKKESVSSQQKPLELKSEKRIHKVLPSEIIHLEGLGNYITYHTTSNKKIIVYQSLKSAQKELGESFIRVHKSFVVNQQHIKSYSKENIEVEGGATIPISPAYRDKLNQQTNL